MKLIKKSLLSAAVLFCVGASGLAGADGDSALKKLWQSDYRGAVAEARTVLQNSPKDLSAWRALAGGLYRLRSYDALVKEVPAAIRDRRIDLNARSGHAYMILKYLGAACLNSGNSRKAVVAFGVAAKIKSDDPDLYNSLGLAYLQSGAYVLSEVSFQTAVALQPANYFYHNNLGAAYLEQNRLRDALACFEKSVRISADYYNGWDNVWTTRRKLGMKENRGWRSYSYFVFKADGTAAADKPAVQQQDGSKSSAAPAKKAAVSKPASKVPVSSSKDRSSSRPVSKVPLSSSKPASKAPLSSSRPASKAPVSSAPASAAQRSSTAPAQPQSAAAVTAAPAAGTNN